MAATLDGYSLKARYLPALVVVLPLWLSFAVWFPPDKQFAGTFASAGVTLVLSSLLAQLGRDAGKRKQPELFREWGGPPTTRALAYRSRVMNAVTLARCHAALRRLIPEIALPADEREESDSWSSVRASYESAADYLREATRDKAAFALVYAENVNYGFRRNLWAMKPAGMAACGVGIAIVGWHAAGRYASGEPLTGLDAAAALICVAFLVLWVFRFTRAWVRTAADEYSLRLVSAAEVLAQSRAE